jgi:carboxylesterase
MSVDLTSHPHPAQSYLEATARIEALRAQEASGMSPGGRLQFLTHGGEMERVIILVHGYTNGPQQFQELGGRFFDLGFNVLLAPLPHHGLADRMNADHARLKAEELATYADEMVDIASGLGRQMVMMGISAGGVITAWAAQNRRELDLAVIISPGFGFGQIPTPLTGLASGLFSRLPNLFQWWDASLQADIGPAHAYPRYATHALGEILRLGFAVEAAACRATPAAGSILMVTNANDTTINNVRTAAIMEAWRAHRANLTSYEFEAGLRLGHDLIDPAQPDARIDTVYPVLIDLVVRLTAGS